MKFVIATMRWFMAFLMLGGMSLPALTFTNLHVFSAAHTSPTLPVATNTDGGFPYARLILSGNTLYGAASGDGVNGIGALFKINTDGTGFTNFLTFSGINGSLTNGDNGGNPQGELTVAGNQLYGTTSGGGTNFSGTVFTINTDGTGFTNLYYFSARSKLSPYTNRDGAFPEGGVLLYSNKLYGTTYYGGTHGVGAIFAVGIDGTGFTNLCNFTGTNGANSDAHLVAAGNTLYGTTFNGGSGVNTNGTIFAIHTDGTGFTNLHNFSPRGFPYTSNYDGAHPQAGLTLSGHTLYGTAALGGSIGNGYGTIFTINTDGSGFKNVLNFNFTGGAGPYGELLVSGNTLYGTTTEAGAHYGGTVFQVNSDGSNYIDLFDFAAVAYNGSAYTNSTGEQPWAGVVSTGSALYGTTPIGGAGTGTIFALTLAAPSAVTLNAQSSNGALVLSWTGSTFSLQSSPTLGGTFTTVPNATSPYLVATTNSQQFYRLQAN